MWYQTQYLRQYALADTIWPRRGYLDAARSIHSYLTTFMRSDDGVFFTSQDADLDEQTDGHAFYKLNDEARRKLGSPRIDTNIYRPRQGENDSCAWYCLSRDGIRLENMHGSVYQRDVEVRRDELH